MSMASVISMLDARIYAVRSRLPGQAGTTAALLSAAVDSLERGIREAGVAINDPANVNDPRRAEAGLLAGQANAMLGQGQAGLITMARTAFPTATPPRTGGGGGGGGDLPVPTPEPGGAPTIWTQLFPEGSPWYQQPGVLIGGAVALGTIAIVLSLAGSKKTAKQEA